MSKEPRQPAAKHYRVTWTIDVFAPTPGDAARKALETQQREDSGATVFDVVEVKHTWRIDLDSDVCDDCGKDTGNEGVNCPDGYYICRECFDSGKH